MSVAAFLSDVRARDQRFVAAHRALTAAVSDARGFRSSDLTEAGIQKRRAQLTADAYARHLRPVVEISEAADATALLQSDRVERARPRLDQDAVALNTARAAWDDVRGAVESGTPLGAILARADLVTALAVREWAPRWLALQSARADTLTEALASALQADGVDGDAAAILRTVDERLAQLVPSFGEELTKAKAAESAAAQLAPITADLVARSQGEHGDGMMAAVQSAYASQGRASLNSFASDAASSPAASRPAAG